MEIPRIERESRVVHLDWRHPLHLLVYGPVALAFGLLALMFGLVALSAACVRLVLIRILHGKAT